ncbi:flagellar biosynthetic protein FliO [Bordetella genomosp. 7]|uniref:Flagellar protein n=1 Tax=Bordetella genomosp. 7 TaxID=1416805 RepID=A0A261RCF2_9BORD|nr:MULTISPECIES: flagellar biosynthetic protein FliO [Bordetella]OZI22352.1 flagellar biosynthetic protein FliO [Bordetella genomosp. 7]OZI27056.1 flagellar biosynthetic protein FliO [Bordetella genomosp. 7]
MTESGVLRVVLGLLLVLAAILLSAWLARRAGLAGRTQGGPLRQVASLTLGPRQSVALLQVEDTWLVVGVTPNQISTLHTLPAGALPPAANELGAFAGKLAQALKRRA